MNRPRVLALGSLIAASAMTACVTDEPAAVGVDAGGDAASGDDASLAHDGDAVQDGSSVDATSDTGSDAARPVPPHVGTFGWKRGYATKNTGAMLAHDSTGNLYVAVNYGATFNVDATHSLTYSGGTDDIAVIALDRNGNRRWTTNYSSTSDEQVLGLASDGTDVYLVGQFNGATVLFGNGHTVSHIGPAGEYEPFVAKLSGADGTAQWAWNFASSGPTGVTSCSTVAVGGGHVAVGCTSDRAMAIPLTSGVTASVGPKSGSTHDDNYVLASLDASTGKAFWAVAAGGTNAVTLNSLAVSSGGAVAGVVSTIAASVTDSTGTLSFGNPRGGGRPTMFAFAAGASDGHAMWSAPFTDVAANANVETIAAPTNVAFDSKGDVLVCGLVFGNVTFNGKTVVSHDTSNGDSFVAHLGGTSGALQWITAYGGTGAEGAASIAVDPWDEIFVSGTYTSGDFAAGTGALPTPPGGMGSYILKLDPGGNIYWGYGTVEQTDASANGFDITLGGPIAVDPNEGGVSFATWSGAGTVANFGDGVTTSSSTTSIFLVHRAP